MGARLLWLLLLLVLASSDARAAGAPLVLYGPGGPDPTLGERALAAFNVQTRVRGAPTVRHAGSVVGDLPLFEVIGAEARSCPGSPVGLNAFRATMNEAFGHVQYVRVEAALSTLERLDGLLPCLGEVLPRDELARIAFLEGVALAYADRTDEARESFRRALVVAPELPWEPRFPPATEALFREAASEALASRAAPLTVSPIALAEATLWIDGAEFPSGGGETELAEGDHLLQWRLADGSFATRALRVVAGQAISARSRADAIHAAVTGQGPPAELERAAAALARCAGDEGVDEIYLAELASVDRIHRFDVTDGRWELADEATVARRLEDHRIRRAGRITGVVGAIAATTGALLGGLGDARARQLLDEAPLHQSPEEFANADRRYRAARSQAILGWTLLGAGGATCAIGIVLTSRGSTGPDGPTATATGIRLQLRPTGLALSGSFR
jgi:hypothetical protein